MVDLSAQNYSIDSNDFYVFFFYFFRVLVDRFTLREIICFSSRIFMPKWRLYVWMGCRTAGLLYRKQDFRTRDHEPRSCFFVRVLSLSTWSRDFPLSRYSPLWQSKTFCSNFIFQSFLALLFFSYVLNDRTDWGSFPYQSFNATIFFFLFMFCLLLRLDSFTFCAASCAFKFHGCGLIRAWQWHDSTKTELGLSKK